MTRPAKTLREAARDLTLMSDDGSEYEHNDGCQGEPECPACWVEGIRQLFVDFPEETAPVAVEARAAEVLLGHQMEWVEGAKTFDCSCNEDGSLDWMGTITEAVQHQVDAMRVSGAFRDEAAVKAEALREAAQAQRLLAADSKTGNGKAEHEDRADWLDDQANAIDPRRLEGAHP